MVHIKSSVVQDVCSCMSLLCGLGLHRIASLCSRGSGGCAADVHFTMSLPSAFADVNRSGGTSSRPYCIRLATMAANSVLPIDGGHFGICCLGRPVVESLMYQWRVRDAHFMQSPLVDILVSQRWLPFSVHRVTLDDWLVVHRIREADLAARRLLRHHTALPFAVHLDELDDHHRHSALIVQDAQQPILRTEDHGTQHEQKEPPREDEQNHCDDCQNTSCPERHDRISPRQYVVYCSTETYPTLRCRNHGFHDMTNAGHNRIGAGVLSNVEETI
mmetsp:Transcript_1165/g.3397  ORF Transcript_1165/g.3397 Transcript_1165/m.3397 type:complete len:274 (+) Transcript_1165:1338-2159(+)